MLAIEKDKVRYDEKGRISLSPKKRSASGIKIGSGVIIAVSQKRVLIFARREYILRAAMILNAKAPTEELTQLIRILYSRVSLQKIRKRGRLLLSFSIRKELRE